MDQTSSTVADHPARVSDAVDSLDNLLSSAFYGNLPRIGVQQNDDMRRITAWVAIVAVPTAVTGFFGQNVPYPGFDKSSGFIASTLIIIIFALVLFIIFKRKGWL